MSILRALAAAAIVFCAPPSKAQAAATAPRLAADKAWSRPAAVGSNAAGYLTLVNRGPADVLESVASPAAARVEMHGASMAGGVMRMWSEQRVAVPANGSVRFAPGGRHLMFVGLKHALRSGDRLPATLHFASGRTLPVELRVDAGGAPAMGPMHGAMHGPMPGM